MKKHLLLFFLALLPIAASADDSGSCGANVTYTFVEATGTLTISGTGAMTDYGYDGSPWYSYRSNIKTVVFTDGVTSIGVRAFEYCSGLTSVTIPNSVTSIGGYAFYGCSGLTSITIPGSVTSISYNAFEGCSGLTSVTIPNSVTSIGNQAFRDCSGLTSLTIGNSVTFIGDQAFRNCSGLTSITVESGNTFYDSRGNCNAIIKKFTNELVVGCKNTVIPNSVTSIGEGAFFNCSDLTSVTIPNSVTSIGNYAFDYCSGLTSVIIPNSVTSIGNYVFRGCSGLTSVIVENSTPVSISYNTFPNRANATLHVPAGSIAAYEAADYWKEFKEIVEMVPPVVNITFADANVKALCVANWDTNGDGELSEAEAAAVTDLGTVFKNKTTITSFDELSYFTGLTSIGNQAFCECSSLTSVTIPNSVTSIGNEAFMYCWGLTSVTIPNSVTSIGDYAFMYCSGLTSVTIGNSVTSIGRDAFFNCIGLTSVTIPNSVTSIGEGAFSAYTGLTSITVESGNTIYDSRGNCNAIIKTSTNELVVGCKNTVIPNSVTSIGNRAFYGCSGLTSVTIPNSVTSIGNEAFMVCSDLTSVIIPNSVTSIGNSAFAYCKVLTSITVESGNTVYDSRENCNAIIKTSTNELITGCKNTVIPNSVTSIGNRAFFYCSGLTSVTIPNSVTSIGNDAFYGCSGLTSLTIGNSVTSIGGYAFYDCSGLASITVESGNTVYDSRGNCNAIIKTSTNELITGCKNTVIPNTVTSIGNYAFYDCSGLTSVTIPNSVTSIGSSAFYRCSGLTSVTCLAENVPTTESNAFSSYYIQNATLLVPAGSLSAYQAVAPWNEFGQITDQTDISLIDNVIYIEPFEARPGRAEREVSIKMKNSAAIRGFQFDLVLPEGVTPTMEDNEVICWLNADRSPKKAGGQYHHTLDVSQQADGSYRFLVGSTQNKTFSGNDGEIIVLKVNVDENLAERDYPIILKNIRLTESDINNYYETDVLLTKMTVLNYMIGDINGDNAVNVSDYIGVANHILGNTPNGFNALAADVNEDNAIDVSDYIGIANIILTGSIYGNSNNAAPAFEEDAELDPQ